MASVFPQGWFVVARSRDVGQRPIRRLFCGTPIVLFRSAGGLSALHDRCPHRSGRLSDGRLVDGDIECPYHGWRFNGVGQCTKIPIHVGETPKRHVAVVPTIETSGLVFARNGSAGPDRPHVPFWTGSPSIRVVLTTQVATSLVELSENSFEPTHTLFVHKRFLRGLTGKRSVVRFKLTGADDRVDMIIESQDRQHGWMSQLLEGRRSLNKSAFIAPGIVELQYWRDDRPYLVTTIYLTPQDHGRQTGFAVLEAPRDYGLGYLKAAIFVPMFRALAAQDQRVLRASHDNWRDFGCPNHATSPVDFLRPHIETVLRNERPTVADCTEEYELEL